MTGPAEAIWLGHLATMAAGAPYGAVRDGALAVRDGRILWVGPRAGLSRDLAGPATRIHEMGKAWITPGLIDCHTHLIFAGERSAEFEGRLLGTSYEAAARQGGGILSTVAATRKAASADLEAAARGRLRTLMSEGVTTIEIKSGYGLDLETELRLLRIARELGRTEAVTVRTTLLAAHAVPPEFVGRSEAFVDEIVQRILPAAKAERLADAVDGFLEPVAFSAPQIARVFAAAGAHGLPVKLHADQLSDGGGAALAASHRALSADHLEYTNESGVRAMAEQGVVAVLLPGAYATVGARQPPPVPTFRARHVRMAVATDCNPGSSPLTSLLMAGNLACALFRLTPEEVLAGMTAHAAAALGLDAEVGRLLPGLRADFVVWPVDHPRELAYWMGGLQPITRVRHGR